MQAAPGPVLVPPAEDRGACVCGRALRDRGGEYRGPGADRGRERGGAVCDPKGRVSRAGRLRRGPRDGDPAGGGGGGKTWEDSGGSGGWVGRWGGGGGFTGVVADDRVNWNGQIKGMVWAQWEGLFLREGCKHRHDTPRWFFLFLSTSSSKIENLYEVG